MDILKSIILKVLLVFTEIYIVVFIPILWNYYPLIIVSGSMEPTLKVGGILYYHTINIDDYNKNDILVYKAKNHIISHRIVKISDNSFITKGDANKKNDSLKVYNSQILGKGCNFSIPYIGYYIDFIYHHKYILLIITLVLLFNLYKKEGDDYIEKNI